VKHVRRRSPLIIATYNTHFCQDLDKIVNTITYLANSKAVGVFCLQEVVHYSDQVSPISAIKKKLGKNWSAISHLGIEEDWSGLGTCIIWNKEILHLQKTKKIVLPRVSRLSCHESVFSNLIAGESSIFQRRAIIGTFQFQNRDIQITNIHLDHVGGQFHRKKQLLYALNTMDSNIDHSIVCGDFNTFDLQRSGREVRSLQTVFGANYIDMSTDSGWTADIYRVNFSRANPLLKIFIRNFNVHIRRKLDYIWGKGFARISLEKVDFPGSDHLPIIARIMIT